MRGTRRRHRRGCGIRRIIPADAGNTAPLRTPRCMPRDHPRGCGEHPERHLPRPCEPGSSPRMRGTLSRCREDRWCSGIIPADAGNTGSYPQTAWSVEDHPRGCGEHWGSRTRDPGGRGSSPRMRGTPMMFSVMELISGIIPADAGNTTFQNIS